MTIIFSCQGIKLQLYLLSGIIVNVLVSSLDERGIDSPLV